MDPELPQTLVMNRFMLTTILLWGQDYNNNTYSLPNIC